MQQYASARERISFIPKWEGKCEKWAAWYVKNNTWRCERIHDYDDLMQEAWLVFHNICRSYPRIMDEGHFFATFKRALINKLNDKASRKQRYNRCHVTLPEEATDFLVGRIGELGNAGYAIALLNEMPEEMKLALAGLTANTGRDPVPHEREKLNKKIAKVLGLPRGCNPVKQLKELLQP